MWRHQLRWARTIRLSKGAGYIGLPITHSGLWLVIALWAGWYADSHPTSDSPHLVRPDGWGISTEELPRWVLLLACPPLGFVLVCCLVCVLLRQNRALAGSHPHDWPQRAYS